jgi:glyoxylase-like metal-dependent hydrolase (beta-lactamase superfamily II)
MDFIKLNATCYYFHSAVNIGYVHHGEEGMLIDAGIDKGTMKKVLKELKQHEFPVTHLFITHAHSDHYGGVDFLHNQYEVHTIAPVLEEAIMRYPVLEPLYLFGGNDPLPLLRNKFLEGKPVRVDQALTEGTFQIDSFRFDTYYLPGHSYHQLAIKVDDILYAADSYFGLEQFEKHRIPFLTDAQLTLESLEKVKQISCSGAVPGHGEFEVHFEGTIIGNIAYHHKLLKWLEEYIGNCNEVVSHETIVAEMCMDYNVNTPHLSQWLLFRTAITGYLIALIKKQKVNHGITNGRWVFHLNR